VTKTPAPGWAFPGAGGVPKANRNVFLIVGQAALLGEAGTEPPPRFSVEPSDHLHSTTGTSAMPVTIARRIPLAPFFVAFREAPCRSRHTPPQIPNRLLACPFRRCPEIRQPDKRVSGLSTKLDLTPSRFKVKSLLTGRDFRTEWATVRRLAAGLFLSHQNLFRVGRAIQ
jgi:hypothetical protein